MLNHLTCESCKQKVNAHEAHDCDGLKFCKPCAAYNAHLDAEVIEIEYVSIPEFGTSDIYE